MTKTDRRQLLERLTARIDPATRKQHIEEQLDALKTQASRVLISIEQLESDPHAQEVEKAQLDQGYVQLESLAWRIDDLTVRLEGMDKARIASSGGLNRAQRRAADKQQEHKSTPPREPIPIREPLEDEAPEKLDDGADDGDN